MPKFRKKPVAIEAIQYHAGEQPHELINDVIKGNVEYKEDGCMLINTLEGVMRADPGDWIIRGINGELYPCKPDIFNKTYEPVEDMDKINPSIPKGQYCYDENGLCPYWSQVLDKPYQKNGFCKFLDMGDWNFVNFSLLWDKVKECDENMED